MKHNKHIDVNIQYLYIKNKHLSLYDFQHLNINQMIKQSGKELDDLGFIKK